MQTAGEKIQRAWATQSNFSWCNSTRSRAADKKHDEHAEPNKEWDEQKSHDWLAALFFIPRTSPTLAATQQIKVKSIKTGSNQEPIFFNWKHTMPIKLGTNAVNNQRILRPAPHHC